MVLPDGDQALAAEPGFHGDPPQSGGCGLTALRHLSGHYSELVDQQPENGLALGARASQLFASARPRSRKGSKVNSRGGRRGYPWIESAMECDPERVALDATNGDLRPLQGREASPCFPWVATHGYSG